MASLICFAFSAIAGLRVYPSALPGSLKFGKPDMKAPPSLSFLLSSLLAAGRGAIGLRKAPKYDGGSVFDFEAPCCCSANFRFAATKASSWAFRRCISVLGLKLFGLELVLVFESPSRKGRFPALLASFLDLDEAPVKGSKFDLLVPDDCGGTLRDDDCREVKAGPLSYDDVSAGGPDVGVGGCLTLPRTALFT